MQQAKELCFISLLKNLLVPDFIYFILVKKKFRCYELS